MIGHAHRLPLLGALALAGCPGDTSFLFPGAIDGVPALMHIGAIEPVEVISRDQLKEEVVYAEIGPTGNASFGGATFTFKGTDGPVCVWMDPELVFWNVSVDSIPNPTFRLPDNVYDDGDLDMTAGLSVFYTGTFGESKGDFQVTFEDDLGVEVPVAFLECGGTDDATQVPPFAGRGTPEFCSLESTVKGSTYTVLLDVWSTPVDDSRLGFGVLVTQGSCSDLESVLSPSALLGGGGDARSRECFITGEAVKPDAGTRIGPRAEARGYPERTWVGRSEVTPWEGSEFFEESFCASQLFEFCRDERRAFRAGELDCSWEFNALEQGDRCFCGDLDDTPNGDQF